MLDKNKIICFALLLIMPISINASTCEENKSLANQVNYDYKIFLNKELNMTFFKVKINNLKDGLIAYSEDYDELTQKENTFEILAGNKLQEVPLIIKTSNCPNLKTLIVKLPQYNSYHNEKICKGIEDYKYCKETFDEEIDSNLVYDKIISFKNSLKNKDFNIEKETSETEKNKLSIPLLISAIALSMILIGIIVYVIIDKRKRRGKL